MSTAIALFVKRVRACDQPWSPQPDDVGASCLRRGRLPTLSGIRDRYPPASSSAVGLHVKALAGVLDIAEPRTITDDDVAVGINNVLTM